MIGFGTSAEWILIMLLGIAAFIFFSFYFSSKTKEGESILRTELCYEIYFKQEKLKSGRFVLNEGDLYRFGYSRAEKYHNNVAIEKFMDEINEYEESEIEHTKKTYKTWFFVTMDQKKIFIKPSYSKRESIDGHKRVYLRRNPAFKGDNYVLNDNGEEFAGVAVFSSEDTENPAFEIYVYDENSVND